MELYNNISDYSSLAGVFCYDNTAIPSFCYDKPRKLTPADKAGIFALAYKISSMPVINKRIASGILKKMQKEGDFPLVTIHSKWLVKFAVEAAQSL